MEQEQRLTAAVHLVVHLEPVYRSVPRRCIRDRHAGSSSVLLTKSWIELDPDDGGRLTLIPLSIPGSVDRQFHVTGV
jgi:hypothetical protein